jgi:hypothetical protein
MKTEIRHVSEPLDEYGIRTQSLFKEIVQVINHSGEDPEVVITALTNAVGAAICNTNTDDRLSMIREYTDVLTRMVTKNEAHRATKQ